MYDFLEPSTDPSMDNEELFHNSVHRLYFRILSRTGPPISGPLAAIVKPSLRDQRILRFDTALHNVIFFILVLLSVC